MGEDNPFAKVVAVLKDKKTWIGLALAAATAILAYVTGLLGGGTPAPTPAPSTTTAPVAPTTTTPPDAPK
jgi:hypothetical protein